MDGALDHVRVELGMHAITLETGFLCVALAGLELTETHPPLPPKC